MKTHVRKIFLEHTQAKGPCYARALAQTLWEGEDYFLQIDSHMRFVEHWYSFVSGFM